MKYDGIKTANTIKSGQQVSENNAREKIKYLQYVSLASAVRANQYVQLAKRQRNLLEAAEVLYLQTMQSLVHTKTLASLAELQRSLSSVETSRAGGPGGSSSTRPSLTSAGQPPVRLLVHAR
jgi:hypothetical protein